MKENGTERKCYIFGAGECPQSILPKKLQGFVIAADGGFAVLRKNGILPDLWVGDSDSLEQNHNKCEEPAEKEKAQKPEFDDIPKERIIRHPPEKDDTDMLLAVKEGFRRGYRNFWIYGGLGGRLDHTFANIQTLEYIAEQGGRGYLTGEAETLTVIRNDRLVIPKEEQTDRKYISVFCMGDRAEGVYLKNLKYPLENGVLTNGFPIGVSNEFTGEQAEIRVEKGSLLVILENRK